jgi:hypothetical protein
MITPNMFRQGFLVLGFDLTPDISADEAHISLACPGNVRSEARFTPALTEQAACIVYAEYTGKTEIGNTRNVTVE